MSHRDEGVAYFLSEVPRSSGRKKVDRCFFKVKRYFRSFEFLEAKKDQRVDTVLSKLDCYLSAKIPFSIEQVLWIYHSFAIIQCDERTRWCFRSDYFYNFLIVYLQRLLHFDFITHPRAPVDIMYQFVHLLIDGLPFWFREKHNEDALTFLLMRCKDLYQLDEERILGYQYDLEDGADYRIPIFCTSAYLREVYLRNKYLIELPKRKRLRSLRRKLVRKCIKKESLEDFFLYKRHASVFRFLDRIKDRGSLLFRVAVMVAKAALEC